MGKRLRRFLSLVEYEFVNYWIVSDGNWHYLTPKKILYPFYKNFKSDYN